MLGNPEKMVVISSTTNEWPQVDEKNLMASTGRSTTPTMEKQEQQQPQQPLKCPRCDSWNTKFCYYNNYSLSQPRHFCKACKRYWTRGGTLRNVPVGGGCRKNKRVKRPTNSSSSIDSTSSTRHVSTSALTSANPNSTCTTSTTSLQQSHPMDMNPLFFGLPTSNPSEILNLPFPRFNNSRPENISGYDLQPQLNALGLGFSSGLMSDPHHNDGFNVNSTKQIQEPLNLSNYNSIFGSSSLSSSTTTPIMASLLASTLPHQQRYVSLSPSLKEARGLDHFEGLQIPVNSVGGGRGEDGEIALKEVKMEGGGNKLEWINTVANGNPIEQFVPSDPSLYWNSSSNIGANWPDLANIGSSVPSLI